MSSCRHHIPVATASDDRSTLEAEAIDRISQQLAALIGLDAERIGHPAIARGIQTALERLSNDTTSTLDSKLQHPDFEQFLIEAVVVSESWFLREPHVFEHAVDSIKQRLLQQQKVTILSAPCAAGEEAFSLSLSLLDAGVPADRFQIVAIDISADALESAYQGIFTKNAFRVHIEELQSRWFTKTTSGWKIDQLVSRQVHFMQLNLLDESAVTRLLAKADSQYDLIYCRNLLIYLTSEARRQTQANLQRLLSPQGEVVVGAAEAVILATDGWQPSGPLAFCKRPALPTVKRAAPPAAGHFRSDSLTSGFKEVAKTVRDNKTANGDVTQTIPPAVATHQPPPAPKRTTTTPLVLKQAEQLANAGNIEEAISCCQAALQEDGPEPAVLFLAAMLEQSIGRFIEAERLLEKVVYLEPRHEAALLALALAAGRRGDTALERRYRRSASLAANHNAS